MTASLGFSGLYGHVAVLEFGASYRGFIIRIGFYRAYSTTVNNKEPTK